jgi:hypothetical protein
MSGVLRRSFILFSFVMALLLIQGAMAVTTGLCGSSVSGYVHRSVSLGLTEGGAYVDSNVLGFGQGVSLDSATAGSGDSIGPMNEEHTAGTPGGSFITVYGYLDDSDSWTYKLTTGTCSCYVRIGEVITVTNGDGLFFGGFAYNSRGDYAAAQVVGSGSSTMSYSNDLMTNVRGARALQTMSNAKGDLVAENWAENGPATSEVRKVEDLYDAGVPVVGPQGYDVYTQFARTSVEVDSTNTLKTYDSMAESSINSAKAKLQLKGDNLATLSFEIVSGHGRDAIDPKDLLGKAGFALTLVNGNDFTYSASASTAKGKTEAMETGTGEADEITWIGYAKYGQAYTASGSFSINGPSGTAFIKMNDKASSKADSSMLSQKNTALGRTIQRSISTGATPAYAAASSVLLNPAGDAAAISLSGSSVASASSKMAKISGSWVEKAPSGIDARREWSASNGIDYLESTMKWSGPQSLKEYAEGSSKKVAGS